MTCRLCFAGYDPTPVTIDAAGYGGQPWTSWNPGDTADAGYTYIMKSQRIAVTGTLTRITFRYWSDGTNCDLAALKILTKTSSYSYHVNSNTDITTQVNAAQTSGAGYYTVNITTLSIPVIANQVIGIYFLNHANFVTVSGSGFSIDRKTGNYVSGAITNTLTGVDFPFDAYVTAEKYVALADTNNKGGYRFNDVNINIPSYAASTYYITLEGISGLGATDIAKIGLRYTSSTTTVDTESASILLDYSNNLLTFSPASGTCSKPLQQNKRFNLNLYRDVTNSKMDVFIVDYNEGRGPYSVGGGDIRHLSVCDRTPQTIATGALKRIHLSQSVGTGATCDKIAVYYKPIIVVGDSFVATQTAGNTVFDHVGADLNSQSPNLWSKTRYCINAGISGDSLCSDAVGYHTSVANRWDSNQKDLIAYKNCIVVLVNGPGLNDIASPVNNLAGQREFVTRLTGYLGRIVGDAIDKGNDVVLCQMIPYTNPTYANTYNASVISQYNDLISEMSYRSNIPMASMAGYNSGYVDDGTHPSTAGDTWIAQQIVMAYEHNMVSGASPCQYSLAGDLNDDCKVDLYDFAKMASNWLINCGADPNNPECYTK